MPIMMVKRDHTLIVQLGMRKLSVEQIANALPALPTAVWNVLRLTSTPTASIAQIEQAITGDPALTSALLKLANSAYYGLPRRVNRIGDAIVFLGTKVVRNIAITISTLGIWSEHDHRVAAMRQALWCCALQKAVAAKALAKQVGGVDGESAFLAGLLHDIGHMVLLHYQPAVYIAREHLIHQPLPDLEMESNEFGMSHVEVGGLAGEKWQLPATVVEAIAFHHAPCAAPEQPHLSAVVFLSDCLTWGLEHWTETADMEAHLTETFPALPEVLSLCGLTTSDTALLLHCVEQTHEDVVTILSLIYPGAPLPKGLESSPKKQHTTPLASPRPVSRPEAIDDDAIRKLEDQILREQRAQAGTLHQLLEWLTSLFSRPKSAT